MTSEAAALTEQIAGLLAEHDGLRSHGPGTGWFCRGCGQKMTDWPTPEQCRPHESAMEVVHRAHIAEVLAARLADSRPVVSEAAIEAAVKAMVQESNQFKPASYDRMARAALTAALPHTGDGRGDGA